MNANSLPTTDPTLVEALRVPSQHVMTPAERRVQRRSFVIGQIGCSHPEWSRAEVEALVDSVLGAEAECACAASQAAPAYVDGQPAEVFAYDPDLGRVLDDAPHIVIGTLAERCRLHADRMSDGGYHTTANVLWDAASILVGASADPSTSDAPVADLIAAYKRLGGLLAEAEVALAAETGARSTLQSNFNALLTLYADACATIWEQVVEIARQDAILTDKVAETRLVQAGPSRSGFLFQLEGGPIQYIAEYLFQMLDYREPGATPSNYAEIEVSHGTFGPMTLTLQPRAGLTPHQKAAAAEAKLSADPTDDEVEAACEAGWEELRSLILSDPAQSFEIGPWSTVPPEHAEKGRAETRAALTAFLAKRRG